MGRPSYSQRDAGGSPLEVFAVIVIVFLIFAWVRWGFYI